MYNVNLSYRVLHMRSMKTLASGEIFYLLICSDSDGGRYFPLVVVVVDWFILTVFANFCVLWGGRRLSRDSGSCCLVVLLIDTVHITTRKYEKSELYYHQAYSTLTFTSTCSAYCTLRHSPTLDRMAPLETTQERTGGTKRGTTERLGVVGCWCQIRKTSCKSYIKK